MLVKDKCYFFNLQANHLAGNTLYLFIFNNHEYYFILSREINNKCN